MDCSQATEIKRKKIRKTTLERHTQERARKRVIGRGIKKNVNWN